MNKIFSTKIKTYYMRVVIGVKMTNLISYVLRLKAPSLIYVMFTWHNT